jgi:hypothetical protein
MMGVLDASLKFCHGCKAEKPISSDFWKGQSKCIACSKEMQKSYWNSRTPKKRLEQHLKYKYSLTVGELLEALERQNGGCAICSSKLPDLMVYNNRKRGYAIDHNHETGEFRGILCLPCNTVLGMAKDSPDLLERAASYLKDRGFYHEFYLSRKVK